MLGCQLPHPVSGDDGQAVSILEDVTDCDRIIGVLEDVASTDVANLFEVGLVKVVGRCPAMRAISVVHG